MKQLFGIYAVILVGVLFMLNNPATAIASSYAKVSPYSWDSGLYATVEPWETPIVKAWGTRKTTGSWGTGPVNYQSGATSTYRQPSTGTLGVDLYASACPSLDLESCTYGTGSGYKSIVQFWNDPDNYVAIGFIHDPGVSPTYTTLMVEGAAYGKPIGGYWSPDSIVGRAHHLNFAWSANTLTVTIDRQDYLKLVYPIGLSQPSISFLGAARNTGDTIGSNFIVTDYSSNLFTQQ